MKQLITIVLNLGLCFTTICAQVNSNPGTWNWNDPSAWVGGSVPLPTQVVNISNNSIINLDAPVVHNMDINILNGGSLASGNPLNTLTVNNGDVTLASFSSILNFLGVNAVDVFINDGDLINGGVFMCGNLTIDYTSTGSASVNNGDFFVSGNMALNTMSDFTNNLSANITGRLDISTSSVFTNNRSATVMTLDNYGTFTNSSSPGYGFAVTDSAYNQTGAIMTSDSAYISVAVKLTNNGSITFTDSIYIGWDIDNFGTVTNNGGIMDINSDLWNDGLLTGSANGNYLIDSLSFNTASGTINGVIDVCDATLLPGSYLDTDNGTVDFVNVTFCSTSFLSIEDEIAFNLHIYPNPTQGEFTIQHEGNYSVTISTMSGKIIESRFIGDENARFDISSYPKGIYLVKISTNGQHIVKKLIKQ